MSISTAKLRLKTGLAMELYRADDAIVRKVFRGKRI
jgi:hypothetical protein